MRKWLLAALIASGALAASSAGGASFVSATNCVEHQAFVDGDDAYVAAHLPRRYTAVRDSGTGRPLVFVRALWAAWTATFRRSGARSGGRRSRW